MAELGGTWTDADAEAMVGGPLDRVARFMVDRVGGTATRRASSSCSSTRWLTCSRPAPTTGRAPTSCSRTW